MILIRDPLTNVPDGVVCKDVLFHNGDIEWAIALATITFRPVLFTFLGSTLLDIGHHGNSLDFLLPHQSPEVSECIRKGSCVCTYISIDT